MGFKLYITLKWNTGNTWENLNSIAKILLNLGAFDDDDYDAKMMECAQCGGWIHAKCEGLDAEKYQILSYLPNTVDYVCK